MRRALALALTTGILAALPGAAHAQGPSTDPEIGSPSESVYGIPLEEARRDAAPRGVPGSAIRTENTGGSSSRVPGRRGGLVADNPEIDPKRLAERRRARRREAIQVATRLSGDPSATGTTLMLLLVVAIALGGGLMAGRLLSWRPGP
jgi:hypothetical protein